MGRTAIWTGDGADQDGDWHVEFARVELGERGLTAAGIQLGTVPEPYRLEYTLDAGDDGFVTRSLRAESIGAGWERRLRLERDSSGEWSIEVGGTGSADFGAPGGDHSAIQGALDCDLALSPLTNAMPVHRHSFLREPGEVEFLMAWVSVPDLSVHASRQRYTHLRSDRDAAIVRFAELEEDEPGFTSDLEFAADGLVSFYPKLARRIEQAS